MPDQIPENTMKMLTDEAWDNFTPKLDDLDEKLLTNSYLLEIRHAFITTIKHAFEHAFEEGIIVLVQEMDIEHMASALALAEGFDPNKIPPDTWERAKRSYERKATNVIKALESMNG